MSIRATENWDETEAKSVRGMCECEKDRFNLRVILGLSRSKKYRDDWNDQNDLLQGSIRPMMILTQNIWHWQKFMIAKNHHQWTKYGANIPCFMSLLKSDLHIFWLKIAAKRFQKIEADTALPWHWLHWTNSVLNSDCLGDRETGDDDLLIWSGLTFQFTWRAGTRPPGHLRAMCQHPDLGAGQYGVLGGPRSENWYNFSAISIQKKLPPPKINLQLPNCNMGALSWG